MPAIDVNRWMSSLFDFLQQNRQRQLVVLQGSQAWCDKQCRQLLRLEPSTTILSDREICGNPVAFAKAETLLGGETRLAVVDLFYGLNPDVLCIAAGLVRQGGVLLLLAPPPERWNLEQDRYARWQDSTRSPRAHFVNYFFARLDKDARIGIVLTPRRHSRQFAPLPVLSPTPLEAGVTPAQAVALATTERWLQSGRGGVVLIDADRGRGKSTCLGLLAERLLAKASVSFLVTADSRQTAANLLARAPASRFVAPDALLQTLPAADLVIVDEAAMIPLSMLRRIRRSYPRLVMATTSGGYEGTGRGFMLRFVAALETHELLRLRLEQPIRWCSGDLLEAWLDRVMLLSAEPGTGAGGEVDPASVSIAPLRNPGSPRNAARLRQLYRLLTSAHYRTQPSDLRMLMENPDLLPLVTHSGKRVVGAALLNFEGGFDESLCTEVFLGRRRPRGHLLAQMLTAQAGVARFACLRGARVQRIAVAVDCRRRGIGKRMLEHALGWAREQGLDYIGASFAIDPDNVDFWRRAGFALVHVSFAAGKSSGNQSIAVLRAVNPALEETIDLLRQRIQRQLPVWMTQFLQGMEAEEVVALLRFADYAAGLAEIERREVEAFAHGEKGFELCFASLQRFVMRQVAQSDGPVPRLLIEKAVQNRDWAVLERNSGVEGRRQLQRRLRGLVDGLIKAC